MVKHEAQMFINNEYVKGSKASTFNLKSPATEEVIGEVYQASAQAGL
jgi:acyl-CoA reductase-like NAD-dependent aldehyde dehydrogenase